MPNIKSAVKRMRQNAKRRTANRGQRSAMRTSIKTLRAAMSREDLAAAESILPTTISVIGKCAQKGLIHKNKASRYSSRLQSELNALKSASVAESSPSA